MSPPVTVRSVPTVTAEPKDAERSSEMVRAVAYELSVEALVDAFAV